MNNSWAYKNTQDRLRIFVSSRLKECATERKIVASAIKSLNHQPVLFEHIGARPYSPRDLYLSRLSDSQAMIAIYNRGYGYVDVANGMEISGLEDEYRHAVDREVDSLFYVCGAVELREERLSSMIDEIAKRNTISFYDEPNQLFDRVRDDLTAVITERFLSSPAAGEAVQENAAVVLSHAIKGLGFLVRRDGLIEKAAGIAKDHSILCIHGPAGIGKTTLAAQLSQNLEASFVRLTGLAPKDIFAACRNIIIGEEGLEAGSYATLSGARLALASAWADAKEIFLIVDECEYIPELIDAISLGGGLTSGKRLIFTSRSKLEGYAGLEIPLLTLEEVNRIIAESPIRGRAFDMGTDAGSPLRVFESLNSLNSIPDFYESLSSTENEVVTYLALSPMPLTSEQILSLRASQEYSEKQLEYDIARLGAIVSQSPKGYRLVHLDTARAISDEVKKLPQRYSFFVNQILKITDSEGLYRESYELALTISQEKAKKYAMPAFREGAKLGDWKFCLALANNFLSIAIDDEDRDEALNLMLSQIYPLELMGDVVRADEVIERAKILAGGLGGEAKLKVDEVIVSSRARRAMQASDVSALINIYSEYKKSGKVWDQARLGLELSALYLAAKDYEAAVNILRPSLSLFEEIGDEYGVDVAQRNMASALSALPGNEEEAEKLIEIISARADFDFDNRRQRAWLCNILTRKERTAGRYESAEKLAREALTLAEELGDQSLLAINLVNLGNVLRDKGDPKEAIERYEAAAITARKCGRQDIEADASRLTAGVFNDFEAVGKSRERREKAKFFSQHAITLSKGSLNRSALIHAYRELAEAYEELGEIDEAIDALFTASELFEPDPEGASFGRVLLHAASLALSRSPKKYIQGMIRALNIQEASTEELLAGRFLDLMRGIFERAPKSALISLLGLHLKEVWRHLPSFARVGYASAVVEKFCEFSRAQAGDVQPWRLLHASIAIASFLKEVKSPYLFYRLSESISNNVEDIFVREEEDGSRVWTVIINAGRRVTISVAPLDSSIASSLAALALAAFIKAFEDEINGELIGGKSAVGELLIQVSLISEVPDDLRETMKRVFDIDEVLNGQPCAVSRPTQFSEVSPTLVFLSRDFLNEMPASERSDSALSFLFGLTIVEIVYQLLRGEVDMEVIRPKVVSLVHKTII